MLARKLRRIAQRATAILRTLYRVGAHHRKPLTTKRRHLTRCAAPRVYV